MAPRTFRSLTTPRADRPGPGGGAGRAASRIAGHSGPDRPPRRPRHRWSGSRPTRSCGNGPARTSASSPGPTPPSGPRRGPLARPGGTRRKAALAKSGRNRRVPARCRHRAPTESTPTRHHDRSRRADAIVTRHPPAPAPSRSSSAPWPGSGRWTLATVADLGRMATLLAACAVRSLVRPRRSRPAFVPGPGPSSWPSCLAMGLPLVAPGPRGHGLVPVAAGVLRRHVRRRHRRGGGRRPDPQPRPDDGRADAGRPDRGADHPRTPQAARVGARRRPALDRRPRRTGRPPGEPASPSPDGSRPSGSAPRVVAGPILALWGALVGTSSAGRSPQTMLGVSTARLLLDDVRRCSGSATSPGWSSRGWPYGLLRGALRLP